MDFAYWWSCIGKGLLPRAQGATLSSQYPMADRYPRSLTHLISEVSLSLCQLPATSSPLSLSLSLSCPVGPTSNTCHVLTPGVCRPVARAASAHLSHLLPRYKSKEAVYLSVQQGHLAAAAWLRDVLGRGEGRTFKLFSLFWKI